MKILLFSEATTVNVSLLEGQCSRVQFAKRLANAPAKLQNKNTTAQSTLGDTGSLSYLNTISLFVFCRVGQIKISSILMPCDE